MKAQLTFICNEMKVGVRTVVNPKITNAEIAMLIEHLDIEKEKLHELYKLRVNEFKPG